MASENKLWLFEGYIEVNHIRYESGVTMQTWAPTQKKAMNNLRYRYRKDNGLHIANSVELFGTFKEIG